MSFVDKIGWVVADSEGLVKVVMSNKPSIVCYD